MGKFITPASGKSPGVLNLGSKAEREGPLLGMLLENQRAKDRIALGRSQNALDAQALQADTAARQQALALQAQQQMFEQQMVQKQMAAEQQEQQQAMQMQRQMQTALEAGDEGAYMGLLKSTRPEIAVQMEQLMSKERLAIRDMALQKDKTRSEMLEERADFTRQLAAIDDPAKQSAFIEANKTLAESYGITGPLQKEQVAAIQLANKFDKKESTYEKELGKSGANIFTKSVESSEDSLKKLQSLETMRSVVEEANIGLFSNLHRAVAKITGSESALADAIFSSRSNLLALSNRKDMPGPLSDSDVRFLKAIVPSEANTPEQAVALIDNLIQAERRRDEFEQAKQKWLQSHNGDIAGFRDNWKKYAEENPLFGNTGAAAPVSTGNRFGHLIPGGQ